MPESERLEEWGLLNLATEAVRSFVADGLIPQTRDRQGNLILRFPRLALDWLYFEKEAEQPAVPSMSWSYRGGGDAGQEQGLSAAEVAERVKRKPGETHRVWSKGMDNWRNAHEVPEIAQLLETTDGPPVDTVESEKTSPSSDDGEMPPPLVEPGEGGPIFFYACDERQIGKLSADEIARRVAESPGSIHRVWTKSFGSSWKAALDVPEIATRMPDLPPPLA
jgi:hypothetical protein